MSERYECRNPRCPFYAGVGVILGPKNVHPDAKGLAHCNACTSYVVLAPLTPPLFPFAVLVFLFFVLLLACLSSPRNSADEPLRLPQGIHTSGAPPGCPSADT